MTPAILYPIALVALFVTLILMALTFGATLTGFAWWLDFLRQLCGAAWVRVVAWWGHRGPQIAEAFRYRGNWD